MLRGLTGGEWEADCSMSYISVSEEEGAEPIELPTEEDGTGQLELGHSHNSYIHLTSQNPLIQ